MQATGVGSGAWRSWSVSVRLIGGAEAFQHRGRQALRIALIAAVAAWFRRQSRGAGPVAAGIAGGSTRGGRHDCGSCRGGLALLQAGTDLRGLLLDAAAGVLVEIGLSGEALYYVALFQEKNFWRVIKTDAVDNAERVYRTFAQQSEQLAQVYIDTTRLEAGKRYTERLVAYNEERLRTLQQEMEQQQAQSAQVSAALQQAQQQAVSLSTDVQSTNSQLDALQRRIQILQAEQGNPELSLPKPESVPSPAPAAASDGR